MVPLKNLYKVNLTNLRHSKSHEDFRDIYPYFRDKSPYISEIRNS